MNIKGMVLAAGKGTRLYPYTEDKPKPLVEVNHKPIIEYNLNLLEKHGIYNVCVNTCYLSEVMLDYFQKRDKDSLNITVNEEKKMLGSAGGVKAFEKNFGSTTVVLSGDLLTNVNLSDMLEFHYSKKSTFTMGLTEVKDPRAYGIVVLNKEQKIVRFQEKPKTIEEAFSNLINTGIYIFEPHILKYIPNNEFFDFSNDLFPILLKEESDFYGYKMKDYWRDLGSVEQLNLADKDLKEQKI